MLTLPLPKAKTIVTEITKFGKTNSGKRKILAWIEFGTYELDSAGTAIELGMYTQNCSLAGEMVSGKPIIESFKVFTIKESELYGLVFNWVVIQ